jgi:hypothetical protein
MRLTTLLAGTVMAVVLAGCAVLTPLPEPVDIDRRLDAIPVSGLPLSAPVRIHWNEHQVPFAEAESDRDLAVVLPPGGFAEWMKARGQLGGQHKVPRIINDPELFHGLRAFAADIRPRR